MSGADAFIAEFYKFLTPILIAGVGYFLRGILITIKNIETDFSKFREEYAGHRVILQEHRERLEKIDEKIQQNDHDFKIFIMEYGPALKKVKNDNNL